jgi:hypothetical protein
MKKMDLNAVLLSILLLIAAAALCSWIITGHPSGNMFNPAKDNPGWGGAVTRADTLLDEAGGTPNLKELILSKYQGRDDVAAYLLHDSTGKIASGLLQETQDELRAYDDYRSSKYAYQARIESNSLAIYKDGACLATIPMSYVNRHP